MTALGLVTVFDIIETVWSILIISIYAFSAFWYIRLFLKVKGNATHRFGFGFISIISILTVIAFIINLILNFGGGEVTTATLFVIAVIRPLIFLIGCSNILLAHIFSFDARKTIGG